ncbi:M20/M25/M40 family metallo-hydrolase [Halalkalibacillus halophilus]|uniref:M20/M25/M40 family metallo-hydrolase n=1 Tax=Halalkalibacillus halophilus TaxID=392827 RepID=UPI00040A50B6|nr:M20/M25/M40 family metallo-hydrolase [Halalkalibacillus halophilus]
MTSLQQEAVAVLQQLIKIDTSNPSKTEWEALRYLESIAEREGLSTQLVETAPQRGNLEIFLKKDTPSDLLLLSHVDVVPAETSAWTHPPFSGVVQDGWIWGRGTIDTKQLTVIHLFTLVHLKRNGIQLPIQMLVTSDEEQGSKEGLLRYIEKKPDVFRDLTVLNEGGGFPVLVNNQPFHLVELGQKGVARISVRVKPSKSSNPYMPDHQALTDLSTVMKRIQRISNDTLPETVRLMFEIIAEATNTSFQVENADQFIAAHLPSHLERMMRAMTRTTFSFTQLKAGVQTDLPEGGYETIIDCRTLPKVTYEQLKEHFDKALQEIDGSFEILSFSQGYETPVDQNQLNSLEFILQKNLPGHRVVPYLSIGSSDGRHIAPLGAHVYGYCPTDVDMPFDEVIQRVHGVDERISIRSFTLGLEQMIHIVQEMSGGGVQDAIRRS